MRKSLSACGLLLMTLLPALAQTTEPGTGDGMMGQGGKGMGGGMMGPGMMGGMGAGMMMDQEDLKAMVEGRLAYVKTALSITEEQATAWKAYEDAARADVQSMQTVHQA